MVNLRGFYNQQLGGDRGQDKLGYFSVYEDTKKAMNIWILSSKLEKMIKLLKLKGYEQI